MKMNKKFSMIALGATALSLTAVAAAPRLNDSLPQLNAIAAEILAPFQTDKSKASLKFVSLTADDSLLRSIKLNAFYQRTGKAQTMTVTLKELSHEFAGGRPVSKLSGDAAFDLTKLFQQEQINSLVEGAEEMVKDLAKNYTKDYGDSVTIDARMVEKLKNSAGNYVSFKAKVSAKVDLSKLPQGKKSEDMAIVEAKLDVSVVLNKGIALTAEVQHNPAFHGFLPGDKANFKVALEKLLTRDESAKNEILKILKQVDGMAASVVDANTK